MNQFFQRSIAAAAAALALTAGLAAGAAETQSSSMPILMYHDLTQDPNKTSSMTITDERFRLDMEFLASFGYTPLFPSEVEEIGEGKRSLPARPVMITFDDGYRSNYDLVYPILREYGVKACISIIVLMPDLPTDNFCTWNQLREMTASGLVEIGSHSYRLHNLGGDGGNFESGGANGVERRPNESDADFQTRVLDDIQLSHDRIAEELGGVTCFAYPFGCSDPDAKALVDELFPVTLMTTPKCADLAKGLHDLPRFTVTMKTDLEKLLR